MKLLTIFTFLFCGILNAQEKADSNPVEGKWVRMTQTGPVALEFREDGKVEVDFGIDQNTDVVTDFQINGKTITFNDKEGAMCPEPGVYKFEKNEYYLSFDLVDDLCNGRIKMTMGFWTKPDFEQLLEELSQKISETEKSDLHLIRARINLALGKSNEAKSDLDVYLEQNPDDARALINRAATRFPNDMKGALSDCNKAIELEPENKNAWFLRGLANWEMGFKEKACDDFSRAIDLGFSILRIAEEQRCSEYWNVSKE